LSIRDVGRFWRAIANPALRQPKPSQSALAPVDYRIKKYKKNSPTHYKAATIEENFLRSTPFEDDLKKLFSDYPKLGGSQETFLRSS